MLEETMDRGELIRRYFEACSTGSAAVIAGCFTPDAVVYDTNLAPVVGADAAGRFWVAVRERWGGARWQVDRVVAEGDHAACEWTMTGRAAADGRSFAFRGSDHYHFTGDLIAEVRQYWTFDPDRLDTGLVGFAYPSGGRGRG
jgi:ketosteroid isomerase-like protein